jgi:serine/threonine-protein kinase RsbT
MNDIDTKATIPIKSVTDIVTARQRGREMSVNCGFSETEATLVATIISELARNIVLYAKKGEIVVEQADGDSQNGITIVSRDTGPGIPDLQRALAGGYSTSGGLGLGLCGVRRMVDEFFIDTGNGRGTTVTVKKWLR